MNTSSTTQSFEELKRSPLEAIHLELGAKMTPFGGWNMPLHYPKGTIAEHMACRTDAAVFDVSHLGTVRVVGEDAFDRLQNTLTADLSKIEFGRTQYTQLLNDSGGVEDDIIVWWIGHSDFHVIPNASNTSRVVAALGGDDITSSRAILAIQGPKARERLSQISPEAAEIPRRRVKAVDLAGLTVIVAGTGYTGEDGVEIALPNGGAAELVFRALVEAGIEPAGLGARDTLRLEACLPLHGHEISPVINPLEAGLSWALSFSKPTFRGKAAIEQIRERGASRILRALLLDSKRPARSDQEVLNPDGQTLGVTTSGGYSPLLERGIALALVDSGTQIGDRVFVASRADKLPATVVSMPFTALSPTG